MWSGYSLYVVLLCAVVLQSFFCGTLYRVVVGCSWPLCRLCNHALSAASWKWIFCGLENEMLTGKRMPVSVLQKACTDAGVDECSRKPKKCVKSLVKNK